MFIKLSSGQKAEAKIIGRHDNNKIQEVEFIIPVTIKTKVGNLEFRRIIFDQDSKFTGGKLTKPHKVITSIGEIILDDRYYVTIYNSGNLASGSLFRSQTVNLPIGSIEICHTIQFYENGNIGTLHPCKQQRITIPIGNKLVETEITFYKNGNIKATWLAEIYNLKSNYEDMNIKGYIEFYENEKVKEYTIAETTKLLTIYGNLTLAHNIKLYESGNFKEIYVVRPAIIETKIGSLIPTKSGISAKYASINIATGQEFNVPEYIEENREYDQKITFYENGNIETVYLPYDYELNNYQFIAGNTIIFDEENKSFRISI